MGKALIILGAVIVIIGLLITYFDKIPLLGKLPGDIMIKRENFTFYFPITTCIVVSILLTGIFYLIRKLGG